MSQDAIRDMSLFGQCNDMRKGRGNAEVQLAKHKASEFGQGLKFKVKDSQKRMEHD